MVSQHGNESSNTRRIVWGCLGFLVAAFVLTAVGGAIWYAAETARARRELAAEVKHLRDRGAPLTSIELNSHYLHAFRDPAIAQELLAALLLADDPDLKLLSQSLPIVGTGGDPPPLAQPWPQQQEVEQYLAKHQRLLAALEALGKNPGPIHFSRDLRMGIHALLPEVQRSRHAARLLTLQFHVDLRRQRTDLAISRIEQQIAFAESMREEPVMVSQLVHLALFQIAIRNIEFLLQNVQVFDGELARLQAALRRVDLQKGLKRGIEGETAIAYTTSTWPLAMLGDDSAPASLGPEEVERLAKVPPSRPGDVAMMLRLFRRVSTASDESLASVAAECEQVDAEIKALAGSPTKVFYMQTLLMFPALRAYTNAFQRSETYRQSADAGLAALRYRQANQKWPDNLQQLVPTFLPQVPVDPYNGKELLIQVTPTEFKVYSVGQNLVDDGGAWTDKDFADVGFVAPWPKEAP
jgi:hypothetical protein